MSGEPRDAAREEAPHDVLAAEAFAVPAPDPNLRSRQVKLPEDPSGISEPHDVLAAEAFAMPAVSAARRPGTTGSRSGGLLAPLRRLLTRAGLSGRARR